jgi:hypothetical protein
MKQSITHEEAFASLAQGLLPARTSPSTATPRASTCAPPDLRSVPLQVPAPTVQPAEPRSAEGRAEVRPDEWIALGYRVHGGWGSFLTLGIRVGLHAMRAFEAGRRELDVTYFHSLYSPRACVADGLMLSTFATPGQATFRIVPHRGAPGAFGEALIRHKPTGRALRYVLPTSALALLDEANGLPEREGFDVVWAAPAETLFWIAPGLA